MGRMFDNPMVLLFILLVIVVLFGVPRLPGAARSLGRSLRIFRSEVHQLKQDDQPGACDVAPARPLGPQDSSSSH